jgi:predicted transcriptional regulator
LSGLSSLLWPDRKKIFLWLQKDFPVADNGHIEGILTQTDLLKALAARDQYPTVSSAMQNEFVTVESLEMLETAFARLKDCNCHSLPVTLNGKLVGLMTMDNLGEYMRIQAAMKS